MLIYLILRVSWPYSLVLRLPGLLRVNIFNSFGRFPPDGCSAAIRVLCSQWTADCGLFLGLWTAVPVQMSRPLPTTTAPLIDTKEMRRERSAWNPVWFIFHCWHKSSKRLKENTQAGVFLQPVAESLLNCELFSTDRLTRVSRFNTWRACLDLVCFQAPCFLFSSSPPASSFIICQSHQLSVSLDTDTQPIGTLGVYVWLSHI